MGKQLTQTNLRYHHARPESLIRNPVSDKLRKIADELDANWEQAVKDLPEENNEPPMDQPQAAVLVLYCEEGTTILHSIGVTSTMESVGLLQVGNQIAMNAILPEGNHREEDDHE